MDHWQRRYLLESIIYKISKKIKLEKHEDKIIKEIVEMMDC